jgi:phosphatidate cytidylyltransferase
MADALGKRVLTAVVLAALLLPMLLWLPAWVSISVLTLLILAGAWEWSAFLTTALTWRGAYVLLIAALVALVACLAATRVREAVLMLAVLWWLVALVWIMCAPRQVPRAAAGLAGVCVLVPAWLALAQLRWAPQGALWVLFVLLLVWGADIGAFFSGRRFGRIRLAPEVSPGKTWEGVLGGIAVSALVAVGGAYWFQQPLAILLPLSLAAVGFSIVGDLTESLFKRSAGLKDSGSIFPGHGGIMDRIDSLTAAAPVMLLGLSLMGALQ